MRFASTLSLRAVRRTRLLATRLGIRLSRKLAGMPDPDYPDRVAGHAMEEAVWRDGNLAVGEFGELRDRMTRVRVLAQLGDDHFGVLLEADRSSRALGADESQRAQVLLLRLGSEPHLHWAYSPASSARASAITSSALRPSPAAMSASPRARILRISFSCWVRA